MAQFLKPEERQWQGGGGGGHWILDSPLARRSLNGTVERDTVKGSLWRPEREERKNAVKVTDKGIVENYTYKTDLGALKSNHRTKISWKAMGKCRRAAMAQRCYLSCEEGDCVYVCVWRVHVHVLVCVGWRVGGRVCCEGSRVVCLKVPEGI